MLSSASPNGGTRRHAPSQDPNHRARRDGSQWAAALAGAVLALLVIACSPHGNAPAHAARPAIAAVPAPSTPTYFGDEYADRERAQQSRPIEPTPPSF